jgi:hypothetical protein
VSEFKLEIQESRSNQSTRYANGTAAQDRVASLLDATPHLGKFVQRKAIPTISPDGVRYVMPPGCDFIGYLRGGRGCIIEVKYTSEASLELDLFSQPQRDELNDAQITGVCCVAVVLRGLTPQRATVHALPWRVVQIDIDAGNKRISSDTLTAYTVPTNQHLLNAKVFNEGKMNANAR